MPHPALLDRVRLTEAIPNLLLHCGAVGVVRGVWLSSGRSYEVEFRKSAELLPIRALLQEVHFEIIQRARKPETVGAMP